MANTPFDSALYRHLFSVDEVAALFTDSAEVRAMLIVEGALAKAQGVLGLIPEISAQAIHRASLEIQIDPGGLANATADNGVPVPGFVAAVRKAMEAPEHANYLHWGATSQDIVDTALMLRMRQVLVVMEADLLRLIQTLGRAAETHAGTPMAARTWGQTATPTSYGAVVAEWGRPLLRQFTALPALRAEVLAVSLSGAAGTLSAMGPKGPEVRAKLAEGLGLADPEESWHADRSRITALGAWLTGVATALGKLGEDVIAMAQTDRGEVNLGAAGGSSTMPQKQNPVQPSLMVAMARHATGLNATLAQAQIHRQQRDGSAWMTEWMTLPQLTMSAARALRTAADLAERMAPNPEAMLRGLDDGTGRIFAEALSFKLAESRPRADAQAEVKKLCQAIEGTDMSLPQIAAKTWPEEDFSAVFDAKSQLGEAPDAARRFAKAASKLSI